MPAFVTNDIRVPVTHTFRFIYFLCKSTIILDENRYKNRYNQIDKQARS